MRKAADLIFERSCPGRRAVDLPMSDVPPVAVDSLISPDFLRQEPAALPEVSQADLVRHFTGLSQRTFGVDSGFYPLGSCTMKYNPKINEDIAAIPALSGLHCARDYDSANDYNGFGKLAQRRGIVLLRRRARSGRYP